MIVVDFDKMTGKNRDDNKREIKTSERKKRSSGIEKSVCQN